MKRKKLLSSLTYLSISFSLIFVFFLFMIMLLVGTDGYFMTRIPVESEILAAKYESLLFVSFFSLIFTLLMMFFLKNKIDNDFRVMILKPLIGYLLYVGIVVFYFYDQIIAGSSFANWFLSPFGLSYFPGSIRLWGSDELFKTRAIQTSIDGFLIWYGIFFSQILLIKRDMKIKFILFISFSVLFVLFVFNKLFNIELYSFFPGRVIYMMILFFMPIFLTKLVMKIKK